MKQSRVSVIVGNHEISLSVYEIEGKILSSMPLRAHLHSGYIQERGCGPPEVTDSVFYHSV